MRLRVRISVLLSVALLLCSGCARTPPSPAAPAVATNVLIVTIDTLRADRVGVYGAKVETPNIDRLAREGAFAPQATVHTPMTRPSHISLFSGRYPAEHGIRDNLAPTLRRDVPLLAEQFSRQGFQTAAFVAASVLDRQSGLARGFGVYSDRFANGAERRSGDVVTAEAATWLKAQTRFFAWVHLFDVHAPYEPPAPYAAKYAGRPYDGAVAWSDELVGRLINALREAGTLDRTLVIVTSDHGESLGEHGEDVHGYFVYEATLRVPLVFRGPGVTAGTRLSGVARTIDLFPTIAELMALPGAPATSGRSLAPALHGASMPDEPSFAESLMPLLHYGWSDLRAVRDGRWKYILAPRPELYDLERDPGELHDLSAAEPSRARAMRAGLEARLREEQRAGTTASTGAIPRELMERLGSLGYVSPGGREGRPITGADPKDKIEEYKALTTLMQDGLIALRAGRFADAADRFRALSGRGFDSFEVHYYLANAYYGLRRWRDAAGEYDLALKKLPADPGALRGLGESRVSLGDSRAAVRAFEQLVAATPADPLAHVQLGEVYRDLGALGEAARAIREGLRLDPNQAQYWHALGTVLGASGQIAEAEQAFAAAQVRDPNNGLYAYNRGVALERLGRLDDAVTDYRRAASLGNAEARARLAQLGR